MKYFLTAKTSLVVLLAGLLFLPACTTTSTIQSRKQERLAAYQALPPDMRAAVDQGSLKAGMNPDAVWIAWGPSSQVLVGGNQSGETTTWVYRGSYLQETRIWGRWRMYYAYTPISYTRAQVIFANGAVREWQTFPEPPGY